MRYATSGRIGGLGFVLNFLMTLLNSMDEVEASICSSRSVKKEGIYLGCSKMRGSGIGSNGEAHDRKYGIKLPTKTPKLLLLRMLE